MTCGPVGPPPTMGGVTTQPRRTDMPTLATVDLVDLTLDDDAVGAMVVEHFGACHAPAMFSASDHLSGLDRVNVTRADGSVVSARVGHHLTQHACPDHRDRLGGLRSFIDHRWH